MTMASMRPKTPPLLIPVLGNTEKSYCRLCLVNNIGQLELLHHYISAPHIKKLRAHIRLRSQCMICPVYMSDMKSAEAHVQHPRHERQMKHNFNSKVATSLNQRFRCPPCHLVFHCSVALELHLFMTHKITFTTENLPELSEIIMLLSGSSADAPEVHINPECVLCEVKCEAMDDFLMHLFSNVHMKSLRTSTCLVCELKFIHVNDREGHLHAWKHKFHLEKVCISNRLKKLKDMGEGENTGYICMHCMIWCRSWPCFVLHLLDNAHRLCAESQDHPHINPAVHEELQAERVEIQDASLSLISEENWKRWLDQPTELSAWCLVCEKMLLTPETLEKHLEAHPGLESMHSMKKRSHWLNSLSGEAKACNLFECEICSVIFKNDFSLTVHKALRQHYIQQAKVSNGGVLCRCFDCGLQNRSTAPEKKLLTKQNSIIFDTGKLGENVTTVQNHHVKEFKAETNKESSEKSSNSGECEGDIKLLSEKITPNTVSGPGTSIVSTVRHLYENRNITANTYLSTREPSNKAFTSLSNSIQEEIINSEEHVEIGNAVSQIVDNTRFKDNPGGNAYLNAVGTSTTGGKAETDAYHRTNEQTLQPPGACQEKKPTQSSVFSGPKKMVPVVIAAALRPSKSFNNSIHSVLKLKESSPLVPKIRKSSTEVVSAHKRLKGNDYNTSSHKNDCKCTISILEAAVCEELQAFISPCPLQEASDLGEKSDCNTKVAQKSICSIHSVPNGAGGPPVSICLENIAGVSVAFAAAVTVIPQN